MIENYKEILEKRAYVSAKDLKVLMPEIGMETCRKYISEVRQEMKDKGYLVPEGKTKLALTKMVVKKLGL